MPIKVEDHQDTCHLQTQSVTEKVQEERDDQDQLHQKIETTGTPETLQTDQDPLHQIIETTGTPEIPEILQTDQDPNPKVEELKEETNIEMEVTEIVLGHHYQEETEIRTDLDSVKGDQDQDLELHQGEKIVIDQAPVEEHNIVHQAEEKDLDQEAAKEDTAHLQISVDHKE